MVDDLPMFSKTNSSQNSSLNKEGATLMVVFIEYLFFDLLNFWLLLIPETLFFESTSHIT
jgi:hypothetical protein